MDPNSLVETVFSCSNGIIHFVGFLKDIAWVVSPFLASYVAIKVAKFHFEKDIRTKYLLAKDALANQIVELLCIQLSQMWETYNLLYVWKDYFEKRGEVDIYNKRIDNAYNMFFQKIMEAYPILGKVGLYYGTDIIENISVLQDEWLYMMNNRDFKNFDNWDEYRKQKLFPILNTVHVDLKDTVFDRYKKFTKYNRN